MNNEPTSTPSGFASSPEALALDCEGIEKAVAANRSARNAPIDYQPWDMRHGKAWNRYLCRLGVAAVRKARARVKQALASDPPHLWCISLEMLEAAEYSLRVRLFWRNGERADFDPASAADVERLERERNWHARMMEEWERWSRRNDQVPSQDAMYAAMQALSMLRADNSQPNT